MNTGTETKLPLPCQWCGYPLHTTHRAVRYHTGTCQEEAKRKQVRESMVRYRAKLRQPDDAPYQDASLCWQDLIGAMVTHCSGTREGCGTCTVSIACYRSPDLMGGRETLSWFESRRPAKHYGATGYIVC